MFAVYGLLVAACLLTVTGEVLLKLGIDSLGGFEFSLAGLWRTFTHWQVFLGFVLVFGGALFWLGVISRVDLSFAYPLLALNYLILMVPARFILNEQITLNRLIGAAIIVLGVVVITWGQGRQ
jgi:drug/metabolite transporter (DMT)-like permease